LFLKSPLRNKQVWSWRLLLACLVSELQRTSSSGIELRTAFRGCGLRSCNLLFEAKNFSLGAVLLSCLVFELQKPPSLRIELRKFSRNFDPPVLFLV
jgi:hypothetical protein